MNKNYEQKNPCENCCIPFLASYEDCTFCANFEEACIYNGTTIEEVTTGFKPVKTSK